jgi:hypothetical protein
MRCGITITKIAFREMVMQVTNVNKGADTVISCAIVMRGNYFKYSLYAQFMYWNIFIFSAFCMNFASLYGRV